MFVALRNPNKLILLSLKAKLLHWLLHKNFLIDQECAKINKILEILNVYVDKSNEKVNSLPFEDLKQFMAINDHVYFATILSNLSEQFARADFEESSLLAFLKNLKQSQQLTLKMIDLLCGLFIGDFNNVYVTIEALELLLSCCDENKTFTSQLLSLILFKLSNLRGNIAQDSLLHLKLLRAIPKMGILKENLPLIVNVLKLLGTQCDSLTVLFVMDLYYDLWTVQVRSYPLLQQYLTKKKNPKAADYYEYCTVKARIVRDLCMKRPELHGTDMVVHISNILNECKDVKGEVASNLALDALKHLCLGGVIDLASAWDSLEILTKENRKIVLKR